MAAAAIWRSLRGFRKALRGFGIVGDGQQWSPSTATPVVVPLVTDYLWEVGDITDPSGMAATGFFNDFPSASPPNTSTYEEGVDSSPVFSGGHFNYFCDITGMLVFNQPVDLTQFQATMNPSWTAPVGFVSFTSAYLYQYYDGASWHNIPGGSGLITRNTFTTPSVTFASVTATRIRVYVNFTLIADSVLPSEMKVSDIRFTATVPEPPPPTIDVPQNLVGDFCGDGTEVALTWDAVTGLEGYRIYRDGVAYLSIFSQAATGVTIGNQATGVSHCWTVRAFSGILESLDSNQVCGIPNTNPVASLVGTLSKCGRFATLVWSATGFLDDVTLIHYGLQDNSGEPVYGDGQTDVLVTQTGVDNPSGEYVYTLRAHEVPMPQTYVLTAANTCGDDDATLLLGPDSLGTPECETDYSGAPACSTTYTGTPACSTTWS